MDLNSVIQPKVLDAVIRRLRPHWLRGQSDQILSRFERFASLTHIALPAGAKLWVIAPHPDDESIGCGGLIALVRRAGGQVRVVFMTAGENGGAKPQDADLAEPQRLQLQRELAELRRSEAAAALRILGAEAIWLGGQDGALDRDMPHLSDLLAQDWQSEPPSMIAAPYPADRHRDHASAANILALACRSLPPTTPVYGYEVWSPCRANAVLDISAVADEKWRAIACHASQVARRDYVGAARALNTYRAISSGQSSGFAEAYHLTDCKTYAAMVAALRV